MPSPLSRHATEGGGQEGDDPVGEGVTGPEFFSDEVSALTLD
jgi:hypothetical protein